MSRSGIVHTELSVAIWAWARARSRHGSSRRICFQLYFVRFFVVVAVSFYEEPKWKRLTSDVETFSTQQKQQLRPLLQQPRPRESSDETTTHLLTHTYKYATYACMCAKAYDQLQQQQ